MDRQRLLTAFVLAKLNELQDQTKFIEWVVQSLDKPKADIKTEVVAWRDAYRARLVADKEALESGKLNAEQKLTEEINRIDSVDI